MKLLCIKGKIKNKNSAIIVPKYHFKKDNNEIGNILNDCMAQDGFAWIYLVFFLIIPWKGRGCL